MLEAVTHKHYKGGYYNSAITHTKATVAKDYSDNNFIISYNLIIICFFQFFVSGYSWLVVGNTLKRVIHVESQYCQNSYVATVAN